MMGLVNILKKTLIAMVIALQKQIVMVIVEVMLQKIVLVNAVEMLSLMIVEYVKVMERAVRLKVVLMIPLVILILKQQQMMEAVFMNLQPTILIQMEMDQVMVRAKNFVKIQAMVGR